MLLSNTNQLQDSIMGQMFNINYDDNIIIVVLYIIYIFSLCIVFFSFLKVHTLSAKRKRRQQSVSFLTKTFVIQFIFFLLFLFMNLTEFICPDMKFEFSKAYKLIFALLLSNITFLLRFFPIKRYSYINFIFSAYNLLLSAYFIYKIFKGC